MDAAKILVIEDDFIVARTIERSLRSDEFQVILTNRGDKGLRMARRDPPDLVILDIIMPDMDGFTVCRQMRTDPLLAEIPVLFLTAKIKPQDRIAGFVAGADDYLCKPFNVDELILRVQAILRRFKPSGRVQNIWSSVPADVKFSSNQLTVGGFMLDTRTFELHTPRRGKIRLTPLQYDLLYHLMTHPGEPFSPTRLLDEVWDYPAGKGSPDLVRVHIKTLRERVESNPRSPTFICTIPGRGYTVQAAVQ
jgi:DNA-binding response OmpR family regulator